MQKLDKNTINNFIDEIIDNDDFDNVYDLKAFFQFISGLYYEKRDTATSSDILSCFNYAVFLILMDKFDLKDLYNHPADVHILYYVYYCLAKGVRDIDLSPWADDIVSGNSRPSYMITLYDKIETAYIGNITFNGSKAFKQVFDLPKHLSPVQIYKIDNMVVKNAEDLEAIASAKGNIAVEITNMTVPANCHIFIPGFSINKLILDNNSTNTTIDISDIEIPEIDLTKLTGKIRLSGNMLKIFCSDSCKKIIKNSNSTIAVPKIFAEKIRQKLEII